MQTTAQKRSRFSKTALGIACSVALFSGPANADPEIFQGRITDANNTVFIEGAQVRIKELNMTVVSNRDGSFRFANVPEGDYTLVISYLGVPEVEKSITVGHAGENPVKNYKIGGDQQVMENVIVYGQRAGQAGALNRQKNANHLTSIVSASAIGQLPDQNAAEALQRLPGMFIQRDQGEGRFVGIRGIDPNLNNVTINGVNVPSPEAGVRSVAMDVIPSELIQSLEVSKTTTPDMDASAVGGSIEVKSLSAFDRQDESYSVTVQSSYNALFEDHSPKVSGSYSDIYELDDGVRLGVASALSWYERKFGSHNVETDGGWAQFEYEDTNGDDVEAFGAEEIEQRYYEITRERLGAAVNFDLYTSDNDKYFLRTLYSKFSDDEYRLRNEYKFEKGAIDMSSYSATSARFTDAAMDRDTKDRFEEQKILSVVVGGENLVDDYQVNYELGYSKSNESEPNRVDVDFKGEGFALGYDVQSGAPVLYQDAAAHDLSNFEMDEIAFENNFTEDKQLSFKVDVAKDFVWNNYNAQWKVGVKQSNREKFSDIDVTIYDGGFDDVFASNFASGAQDYEVGNFGPGISQSSLRQYVMDNRNNFDINTNESAIENAGNSYTSNEDIFAAYAMLTVDTGDWFITGGVRFERTSFDTKGNQVELVVDDINDDERVNITPWEVSKDYDHLMPSLNVRYTISDDLLTRFAYTQTIARPTFGNAAAFQLIESEISENDDGEVETERKAEVGNPELDPYESNNIDWSIEYYPGHIGVMSAGVFYKDIDNFIVQTEVQDNGQWDGYKEVVQFVNGGSAELTGIELAWHKSFDSGLMLGANGTFVDSNRDMPNLAEEVGNFMVGFENSLVSLRLSATYKSESYQFDDGDSKVFEDSHSQLDFSGKYYLSDTMHLYFNAVNLTDEPYYLYHGSGSYNYQYEKYGRSFEFGFTLTSF